MPQTTLTDPLVTLILAFGVVVLQIMWLLFRRLLQWCDRVTEIHVRRSMG